MNPKPSAGLKDKIASIIQTDGPLPVSVYMTLCLHDPFEGYYATRPGLGADFITAPETSQIFGELLGLWAAHEWQRMGSPDRVLLVEAGPGRGVLMEDALRATRGVPGFHDALSLHLIEASPALRDQQAARLSAYAPHFHNEIEDLPTGVTIFIANELLDCLPARQFVSSEKGWHERLVGLDENSELQFQLSPPLMTPIDLPPSKTPGQNAEWQPGLDAFIAQLSDRATAGPLSALFIDYGPVAGRPGDTLRAYSEGKQVDPLANPGGSDLTVDVDFDRFCALASAAGLNASSPIPQGQFLLSLGAQHRLEQLINRNPDQAEQLFAGADKLINPAHMGERFKAVHISSADFPQSA